MKNLAEMFPMDEIAEFCQRWKIKVSFDFQTNHPPSGAR